MTDRDTFAAAALTGLLYPEVDDEFAMSYIVGRAYLWADAMLRERARTNLDAAPAAIANAESVAPQPTAGDRAGSLPSHSGTGDTPDSPKPIKGCVSDRPTPITGPDPDSRVWETPVHTPAPHATPGEGSEQRECTEPVAWGVANGKGLLATSISRIDAVDMQSEHECDTAVVPLYLHPPVTEPMPKERRAEVSDRPKPINGPDPDSRVWGTHTHATHATRGEGSEQRECTEPEAWAVCTPGDGDWSPCFFHEPHAQRCASAIFGSKNIVPLYRKPTLTDAEAETLRELRDEAAQYADEIGLCASEVRGRQRIIDGLLERLGGGK